MLCAMVFGACDPIGCSTYYQAPNNLKLRIGC